MSINPSPTELPKREAMDDKLIEGLIERLPQPGANFSLEQRAKWLNLAAEIFDNVYVLSSEDEGSISISLLKVE